MKKYIKIIFATALLIGTTSCMKDLEQTPIYGDTSANLFANFDNYHSLLAKVYGSLAISGQNGADGNPDISGIDNGAQNYTRMLFVMQEISTDEVKNCWGGDLNNSMPFVNKITWSQNDLSVSGMYSRLYVIMAFANEFIRNTMDNRFANYGLNDDQIKEAKYMRAEARFIRALICYNLLDMYGNAPYMTETDYPGTVIPRQTSRQELYNFVESELLACADELKAPGTNEYGRVDQAAAWTLLARLYLNSEVYVNQPHYDKVIEYCNKVINSGVYHLASDYANLFKADNNQYGDGTKPNEREFIFPICFDGLHTQTYGGTTYMVKAALVGKMNFNDFGVNDKWTGNRVTPQFVDKFEPTDIRGNFFTDGQSKTIDDFTSDTNGYGFIKYTNKTSTGATGSNTSYCDADIPVFRLADIYLMYAEAFVRGGGGDAATALGYVNALRKRAQASPKTSADLTKDFILDERARELSWEYTRRTDLIRFNKFTTNDYLWEWKGGVLNGQAVDSRFNLYPIPSTVLTANPNLQQNPGY